MEFLKKNYEKVILSVVLLGLAVAAALLPVWVSSEKRRLEEIENMDVRQKQKPYKPLDLSTNEAVLRRLQRPERVQLTREHNLFNPVKWQKTPDGTLVKLVTGNEIGAGALSITEIRPLRLIVAYEGTNALGSQIMYSFRVTREADRKPQNRSPVRSQVTGVGAKSTPAIFLLKDMRPKDDPTDFVVEMLDDKKQITVTKDTPYEGVGGYIADLRYDPDRLPFLNKRLDDRLVFAGDTNKIVAITATTVTVEALSNKKRVTIERKASAPTAAPTATPPAGAP